jgi:hypothetical protein
MRQWFSEGNVNEEQELRQDIDRKICPRSTVVPLQALPHRLVGARVSGTNRGTGLLEDALQS